MFQFIQAWGDSVSSAIVNVGNGVINFVPLLLAAIIIFAIGWVLAALIERLVESIFKSLKVDALLKNAGMEDVVKRAGYNLNSGLFVWAIVKWYVIVVFLIASFEVLNLNRVNDFLSQVLSYLPNVIVAVLILMVAAVVANAMQKIVVASAKAGHLHIAELAGRVTKWAIWIFAIIIALSNLGIAREIMLTVLQMIFAGAALAFGLAFGLGGKETAAKIIEDTSRAVLRRD